MAGRRLKVFQAQFGFYDTVVAAPNQTAALRAWGTHQNLFANGEAKETTDQAAVAAAIAHPQTPLRRAIGSADPFALEPASLPRISQAPCNAKTRKSAAKPKPSPSPRPPADRSKLDAAEKALRELKERRDQEVRGFRCEQDELDARRSASQSAYAEAREAAAVRIQAARAAYLKANGR